MQFNSYVFILIFLPVFIAVYFAFNKLNGKLGKLLLIIGSAVFYLSGGVKASLVLAASIIFNFILIRCIDKYKTHRRAYLLIGIVGNIALLLYFKYTNFLLTNINLLFKTDHVLKEIILPLGISFFTFQQISFLVKVCRGTLADVTLIDYLVYILYFPKLIMGPLIEPDDLLTQMNTPELKHVNWDNLANGIKTFSFGLFKKMVLADTFAAAVSWGYANSEAATSMDWFLVMLSYTFQIYFDFSGYSDMATGVSLMLNIRLPMNFDSPYKALSIRDFWKRWHMSLTGFLTEYIYIPLGGSRRGKARTYLNTMLVFLVSGIWHGANYTFVLWGLLHGILSVFDRIFDKFRSRLMETVRWLSTFLAVNVLWLLFRSDSVTQWKNILVKMCTFRNTVVSDGLIQTFNLPESKFIFNVLHLNLFNANIRGLGMLLFMVGSFLLCLVPENNYRNLSKNHVLYMIAAAAAFIWGFLCLGSESVFVYYNF